MVTRLYRGPGVADFSRRSGRWAGAILWMALAGCGSLQGVSRESLLPIDPSGDWRIIPDDPELGDNCISLRPGSVVWYTTRCDGVNDLVSTEQFEIQGGVVLVLDLTVLDRDGAIGRIQITGTLVDRDTIDGQVLITGGLFDQTLQFDMTMIR